MKTKERNIFRKKQNRFNLSFKEGEVELFEPMEEYLMKEMGIVKKTDLYKNCLKTVFNLRTAVALNVPV